MELKDINFTIIKSEFDKKYMTNDEFISLVPMHLTFKKEVKIRNNKGEKNEEYYRCQFIYSLINSGMYSKDYIGAEVQFPKGNKDSSPIKFDTAIFDDKEWFKRYKNWHKNKDQNDLDWLRKHLICVIEFKNEDSKEIEVVYNQQLKPALKEIESNFAIGMIYDAERLYLFKKKKDKFLRFDESLNLKGDESGIKDLSLHLPDSYSKIPTFYRLKRKINSYYIDRSKRTIDDLEIISGIFSKQLTDGISNILRVMDKVGMKNTRGYEILIQTLALKIYDEKQNQRLNSISSKKEYLKFYKDEKEKEPLEKLGNESLKFFIFDSEKSFYTLDDGNVQAFIERMKNLYKEASQEYHYILNRTISETIIWKKIEHIKIISEIVEQLQDYSFVKSEKTDLYQLVFYKFANEFSKTDKGQFITPIHLIEFLVKIVNPKRNEKIIDPTSGIADFLSISYVNSNGELSDENLYGVDNDSDMVRLAQLNMLLNGGGNAKLDFKPDKGSILWKFDERDKLVELNPKLHKNGKWDEWNDETKLKKFDVVLTNPPFGEDRKYEPKNDVDREIIEMYELWNEARSGNWIDLGLVFLENAYRILKENGRMGIILSNSIASVDRWNMAREWLLKHMRIVALFDLPPDIFADTGVNTTMIVAYKPSKEELEKLQEENYEIFVKDIKKIGYEVRTSKRVKYFNPVYKINNETFNIEVDEEGNPKLDEDFTSTIIEFKKWCLSQEEKLKDLFLDL